MTRARWGVILAAALAVWTPGVLAQHHGHHAHGSDEASALDATITADASSDASSDAVADAASDAAADAPAGPSRSAPTPAAEDEGTARELPTARGLPVIVRAAVQFVELREVAENDGTFSATVDVRLLWQDPRLRATGEVYGVRQWRGAHEAVRGA